MFVFCVCCGAFVKVEVAVEVLVYEGFLFVLELYLWRLSCLGLTLRGCGGYLVDFWRGFAFSSVV